MSVIINNATRHVKLSIILTVVIISHSLHDSVDSDPPVIVDSRRICLNLLNPLPALLRDINSLSASLQIRERTRKPRYR